ncbi:DUF551 domain-containing protein [Enterobacter hormaechei]|uniref:DUF551 domain-containing protein n=1 Tax=Enterobacter hormaechei TaxID=158836 RepID=UPI0020A6337E|nr:DUF551 domain-containing protein [Enterobacter hormaechei]
MSTFTKEQLIEQAKKNIEVLRGAVEKIPGASDAAVIHLKLAEITLASLEADVVCVIDQSNLDYLKSGSDADVWPASRAEMGDVLLYRSATPAPVSVPAAMEMDDDFDSAFEHGKAVGWNAYRAAMLQGADQPQSAQQNIPENIPTLREAVDTIRSSGIAIDGEKILAERDALNSPAIPDGWALVPIEPTEHMIVEGFESEPDEFFSDEEVWEAYDAMSGCQQAAHRAKLCWAAMIEAAPKLE